MKKAQEYQPTNDYPSDQKLLFEKLQVRCSS